jgi:hypothetical protein
MHIEAGAQAAFQVAEKLSFRDLTDQERGGNDESADRQEGEQGLWDIPPEGWDSLIVVQLHGMFRLSAAIDLSPPPTLGQENVNGAGTGTFFDQSAPTLTSGKRRGRASATPKRG